MNVHVFDAKKTQTKTVILPSQFTEQIRPDLIKRAVLALQASRRQKYGASPQAGKRYSAFLSKRRHKYKSTYGIGQSRTPRKVLTRRGTRFYFVGALAPQTVGGRRAHPPKAQKQWSQKVNKKERQKAIRSALAATMDKQVVSNRGHKVPDTFPFILDESFASLSKSKEVLQALQRLGFEKELDRGQVLAIRAGKGKRRGRKIVTKKSFLFVVAKDCPLLKSATNIPGVDVVPVNSLNAELLAPGSHPGRLTLFTEGAVDALAKRQLFTQQHQAGGRQ